MPVVLARGRASYTILRLPQCGGALNPATDSWVDTARRDRPLRADAIERHARAARIAACINACQHLADDQLAEGGASN